MVMVRRRVLGRNRQLEGTTGLNGVLLISPAALARHPLC